MLTEKKTWLWKGKPFDELTREELLEAATWLADNRQAPPKHYQFQQYPVGIAQIGHN